MVDDSLAKPAEGRTPSMYHDVENPWTLRQKLYIPWSGGDQDFDRYAAIARPHTLVTTDRLYVLYSLAKQAVTREWSSIVECGVYKGGTAAMLAAIIGEAKVQLHLFDSFAGFPEDAVDLERDKHRAGQFADTSVEAVRALAPEAWIHPGNLSETLALPPSEWDGFDTIALAHIDVDLYRSVLDCCEALYDRMLPGGVMVFDDYGGWDTPGAREAVDEFFSSRPEFPLVLGTGQAMVVKL